METSSREKRINDLVKAIAANKGAVQRVVTALNVKDVVPKDELPSDDEGNNKLQQSFVHLMGAFSQDTGQEPGGTCCSALSDGGSVGWCSLQNSLLSRPPRNTEPRRCSPSR